MRRRLGTPGRLGFSRPPSRSLTRLLSRPPSRSLIRLLTRPQYEVIPLRGVEEQASHLPSGATMTVTSSPRRGLEPTLALCERLAEDGFWAVPHLSARLIQSSKHLAEVVTRLRAAGIREIFVIGGDPIEASGPFDSALSLLRALAEGGYSFERVGIAGYPERHPSIPDDTLLRAVLDKQPLSSYAVTQICYSPRAVVEWAERVRRAGVRLPILVGMPGPVSWRKLLEISLRIGVGDSVRYLRKNANVVARLLGRGAYRPDAFVSGLGSLLEAHSVNVTGLHLNTFNQVEATERWRRGLLARLREERSLGSTA